MLKPITLLPFVVVMMAMFQNFSFVEEKALPIVAKEPALMPPILSCKTQVTFFYDVNRNGIDIHASELYNSVSGNGLQFFISDTVRNSSGAFIRVDRFQDSISLGLNSLFLYFQNCTPSPRNLVLTVKDDANDSVSCTVRVITIDTLKPQITCPVLTASSSPQCDTSGFGPIHNNAVAFVNAGGSVIDSSFEVNPMNFNNQVQHAGTISTRSGCNIIYSRVYQVTDFFCNTATCSQSIMVRDTASLKCPNDTVAYVNQQCLGNFTPVLSSLVTQCSIASSMVTSNVSNLPKGMHILNVKAVTVCDDTLRCTYKVTMRDTIPPTIICPPNDTVYTCSPTTSTPYSTPASFRMRGGLISDNCDSTNLILSNNGNSGPMLSFACNKSLQRTYTIMDTMNGKTASCIHTIVSRDTTKPNVIQPSNITLFANSNCQGDSLIPRPFATDNCSSNLIFSRTPSGNIFARGTTEVTWTISDSCGNSRQVKQNIIVVDNTGPNLVCKGLNNISLSSSLDSLPASLFVSSTSDTCGGPISLKVRRTVAECGRGTMFGDKIFICCNDVNDTLMVEVQARDTSNNISTCMTRILIQEKNKPSIAIPLPNIMVSCDFNITLTNLSVFGTYVGNPAQRSILNINDTLAKTMGVLRDGLINESCLQSVTELAPVDMRNKGAGNIIRSFRVSDIGGLDSVFTQTITVKDLDTLTLADITWPANFTYTNCKIMPPSPDSSGRPILRADDICTVAGITYSDQIFDNPISGCKYIRRTWEVIDWATYVPNTGRGRYRRVQEITLINNIKPVFSTHTCTPKTVCAPNSDCDGRINLGADATDDCSLPSELRYAYSIDINNDGTYDINGTGDTISQPLAHGRHALIWKVTDGCGNIETCRVPITVKECKAPTAVCLDGIQTNLEDNTSISIWAKDFNNKSFDNCTPQDKLIISFSPDSLVMNRTFTCANRPSVPVRIYFTDLDGNISSCISRLGIQDSKGVCPSLNEEGQGAKYSITGKITTDEEAVLQNTKVVLSSELDVKEILTDKDGVYTFDQLPEKKEYIIVPQKETTWTEGLNTLDLVMIQRHILGIKKLGSPYKIIAADLDNNQKVNSADLVSLRKLILGTITEIPGNTSWRFVNKSFPLIDLTQPWNFQEDARYQELDSHMTNTDFIGIKIGDVSGTVSGNIKKINTELRDRTASLLFVNDHKYNANDEVEIPFVSLNNANLFGLQLKIKLDPSKAKFEGVYSDKIDLDYEYEEQTGMLKVIGLPISQVDIHSQESVFKLKVKGIQSSKISELLQKIDDKDNFYINENDQAIRYNINFNEADKALTMDQNQPNPFSNHTEIEFALNKESLVNITIYNATGSKVFEQNVNYKSGKNTLRINKEDLANQVGIFYVYMSSGENREVKKIMRIN